MNTLRRYAPTAAVSLLAGVGGVATSYAVTGPSRNFVVSPVEQFLTRLIPGEIVLFTIQTVGELGQQLNIAMAVCLSVLLLGGLAATAIAIGHRLGSAAFAVAIVVGVGWLFGVLLTGAATSSAAIGLGSGVVVGLAELSGRSLGADDSLPLNSNRRRIVTGSAVTVGLGALGVGANAFGKGETKNSGATANSNPVDAVTLNAENPDVEVGDDQMTVAQYKQLARDRSLDVDGLEPLVSESFYSVDINGFDPELDREEWSMTVTGNVENELELDFSDIQSYRAENRMVTLRCVGDNLNGRKVDNAVWTGIPIQPILEEAVPQSDSCCVMLRAADDFYEEFPIEALREGFLAFGMNGQTLPRAHGYPLRALIPGHWGEINVKWLTEIEILEEEATGYWEKRGWHGTGPVNTNAKLWDEGIVRHDDGRVTLAGHAYAGTRGVDAVEVSVDGGESWNEATLTEPLPGKDVWRQWSYEFEGSGTHDVVVRAVDGTGKVQTREENSPIPSGATGWVEKTITA